MLALDFSGWAKALQRLTSGMPPAIPEKILGVKIMVGDRPYKILSILDIRYLTEDRDQKRRIKIIQNLILRKFFLYETLLSWCYLRISIPSSQKHRVRAGISDIFR